MEKKYFYFDNESSKLVAFKPTRVYLTYNKDLGDWQITNLFGKKSNGDAIEIEAGAKLYNSVEEYKAHKSSHFNVNDAFGLFAFHKVYGGNHFATTLYYGAGIEINATNYTICVDVENDEYFFVELQGVPMFYTNRDICLFANPLVVDDENGETTIPAERDKYLLTDEQKKAIEEVRKAIESAGKVGLEIAMDMEGDKVIAFDSNKLRYQYTGDAEGDAIDMTDYVWKDKDIIAEICGFGRIYEEDHMYKREN